MENVLSAKQPLGQRTFVRCTGTGISPVANALVAAASVGSRVPRDRPLTGTAVILAAGGTRSRASAIDWESRHLGGAPGW